MKSSGDHCIILSDSSSEWSSLPDLTELSDTEDLFLSRFNQPKSCTGTKIGPDFVIEVDDDSDNQENDVILIEDTNDDTKNSFCTIPERKPNTNCVVDAYFPRQNIIKKCLFVPYLFQSPSTDVIKYGKSLQLQSLLSMTLICSYVEEGTAFANYTSYITDVLYNCKPDISVSKNLFKLLISINSDKSHKMNEFLHLSSSEIYRLLNVICHRYPENIRFVWSEFSEIAKATPVSLINLFLVVELCLSVFESELNEIVSSKTTEIKKFQTYKILANEEAHSSVRCIITMLKYSFNILQEESSDVLEILIHKLQKLLEISVYISCKSISMAEHVAKHLVSLYNNLPQLKYRIKLITSIKSELIRFKMMENILVLYYDSITLQWDDMPVSFTSLAECFFQALPRKNSMFSTYSDIEVISYHEQSCEELIMIIYYTVNSYILYLQRSELNPSSSIDETAEKRLQYYLGGVYSHIELLKIHMKELNPKFTENTNPYLLMMDHITDLLNEDVILSAF
ncbi:uncharacterized protein LOC106871623 [Octopus bimaculoides]|uniref:Uncharacterized protein n=1 Tax=Octopus bimaculoides TaxID=37653 RepID=A0A0L8HBH8_OCTBM|nr:uncharacterized protein LOC106871623 [Octopus bimaculoides]XP_014773678.1 uncharacterized protein LOC106871623 [Octopus bimaculoides]|eukprot:XP_014773677.1 PREDICTED: uncharacterized protein LOC106871623 [Octopus bimaculoides]